MDELNSLYLQMMQLGMLVLRQAVSEHDEQWAAAETELFHNVPNLINDFDVEQYRYFWNATRVARIEWIEANDHETARCRMRVYYDPICKQVEPRIAALASQVA